MTWRMAGKKWERGLCAAGEGGRASFVSRCTSIYDRGFVSALVILFRVIRTLIIMGVIDDLNLGVDMYDHRDDPFLCIPDRKI